MRNFIRRIDLLAILYAFLLLLSPDSAVLAQTADESANTTHFFPLIADGDGFRSRLFVTGVSAVANRCSLSLRGPGLGAGIFQANSALTATGTGAEIDLGDPGGSVVLTSAGGRGLAFGYATLDCAEPTVARMLLSLENGGTPLSLATLESAVPGTSFQFPVLPRFGRLAMVFSNDAGLDAACAVELEDEAGASIGGDNVFVPARSTALQMLGELIPVPGDLEAGVVNLSCNREVAAVGLPLSGAIFTALPPVDLNDSLVKSFHILPLVQDGGDFRSQLLLTNLAETSNQCSVELHGAGLNAGRFDPPPGATRTSSGITLTLAAKGEQASLRSAGVGSLAFGYATVKCAGSVAIRNLLSVNAGGVLSALGAVSGAQPANDFLFPVAPYLGQLALYLNNTATSRVSCAVELPGSGRAADRIEIPGRSTALRYLDDLLAIPAGFPGGMAELNCDGDVAAASLLVGDPAFTAMPPTIVSVGEALVSAATVPDANLRAAINRQLGRSPDDPVRESELVQLRSLFAPDSGIRSLEGLQYAGNLTNVNLSNNQLSGPIPAELGNLTALTSLNLNKNELSGPIPPQLGGLTELTYLGLWDNQLRGPIPGELGNLTALTGLNLNGNELSGPIPPRLGGLTELTYLGLGDNQLSGPIPAELGNLTALTSLNLNGNELSGPIPSQLGGLTELTSLRLRGNQLSGTIPAELGNLTALTILNLDKNELSGPIPPWLGGLTKLTWLGLWDNQLSGPIPAELGNLTALTFLNLNGNELSGHIPPWLGGLTELTYLGLGDNQLSGPIPAELGNLTALTSLNLDRNELSGPIPPQLGGLTELTGLGLWGNRLSGEIPVELGNLTALTGLDLGGNELSGPIPSWLGGLTELTYLALGDNQLSGPIPAELGNLTALTNLNLNGNELSGSFPQTFLQLDELETFYFGGNEDLCVPGISTFLEWLNGIEQRGTLCNESDRKALEHLFELTGGDGWTNAQGWIDGLALDQRHGVQTDSLGRVTALDLRQNGLSGRFPASLGSLTRITDLKVGDNADLYGRFPLSLTDLSIQALHYSGTGLCAPADAAFRDWLDAVPSHEGTGEECAAPSDREILEILYDVTDGPNWTKNQNWIADAPLGEWHGIEVDDEGRVTGISFVANRLKGRIPRELGDLTHLQTLTLYRDSLTGPIPADLADLSNLRTLSLVENGLTGPIPPEMGSITELRYLSLHENDFTGSIPPELGNLADLRTLNLSSNRLTGRIPPELGSLTNLGYLNLHSNEFSGPIPAELGNLSELRTLVLSSNRLTGRIPPELVGLVNLDRLYLGENELTGSLPPGLRDLTRLRTLALQSNAGISGTLPAALANLVALETLQVEGTGLCAPSDAGFLEWLEGVAIRRVAFCEGEPATAYLVQTVQSREFPVPLVASEKALLRVFVTADSENSEDIPPVRASFYRNGNLVYTVDIPEAPGPIPTEVAEGSLTASVNAAVPADVIQPGLEMVVEVDPDETLDAALGVTRRIPATGRMTVDVREVPALDLTLVPFLWTEDPDSEILDAVAGMAADPGHELLELTRKLLPVGDLTVTAHEPVFSSSNNGYDLISETNAIRIMEGATGHYMGMMSGINVGGLAHLGGKTSYSDPHAEVIAHEFGHNFDLSHAPCGGANNPDAAYPHADGTIGAWGYDSHEDELVSPDQFDLMGYCDFDWVGDYNFTKAFHFRVEEEGSREAPSVADTASSLLLWGGADASGIPHLNPAFVVDAAPVLPDSAGAFRVIGRTGGGEEIFAFSFSMPDLADGDESSSFAFALPAQPDWSGTLASITLTGPGGSATLDAGSDQPMAILRNPQTGRVRGILRDPRFASGAAATAASQSPATSNGAGTVTGQSLEILFSRGMPDAEAWRD